MEFLKKKVTQLSEHTGLPDDVEEDKEMLKGERSETEEVALKQNDEEVME